jgi:hypothetical protein
MSKKVGLVAQPTLAGKTLRKVLSRRIPKGSGGARSALSPEQVLSLLEEDQLFLAKRRRFGRAALTPGKVALLWGLRLYVVFMWIVVAVAFAQGLHGS